MITPRPSSERGHADHGWLKTYHSFSFADYFDRRHMGFRSLRVINEDFVAPGKGFGTHPHSDMEIVTIVLEGELEHKDSMGNTSVIRPGEVQRMTAGTGVTHSEFNHSKVKPVHLLQIWIRPQEEGLMPGYEQKAFPAKDNVLVLAASSDGAESSLRVHQDVRLYTCRLMANNELVYRLPAGRGVWIQVVFGRLNVNGILLEGGDGASIEEEQKLRLNASKDTFFLLFDLG